MLESLSRQEQQAVGYYEDRIVRGDTHDHPLWVDGFSQPIFYGLPNDAEVIDVGCGIGRAITMLPDLGINRYFGIDPAASQIAYCKKTFPQFNFEVNEIRKIGESYPGYFDGFLCLAMLMHIPRNDLDVALASLRKCLKTGVDGFLAYPYSDGDVLEYVSPVGDLNCTLFTIDEVTLSLSKNGFVIANERVGGEMFLGHIVAV